MTLDVLYADDDLVAVNKPAGIVVHPTYRHGGGTLLDALRAAAADWPADRNPTIVGRLDKLTSGVVIAATSPRAHAALQSTLASPLSDKVYVAIVAAIVDEPDGTIDRPLAVDPADRRRVIVADGGSPSVTRFERIAVTEDGMTLLHCRPSTGRRHQIRVHLASRGWPIVGDAVYGKALGGFDRHALHAWRVALTAPSGARVRVEAPIPESLAALLQRA
jgi:23S rRNA pseudouridine1911/1915/1917 synthase